MKQKMAVSFKSLMSSVMGKGAATGGPAPMDKLFTKTDPAVDGDDCLHDCDGCVVKYPRGFKIEESDLLYGHVNEWSTHVLIATSKSDWVRDSAEEKGSVMEAIGKADKPTNGVSSFLFSLSLPIWCISLFHFTLHLNTFPSTPYAGRSSINTTWCWVYYHLILLR